MKSQSGYKNMGSYFDNPKMVCAFNAVADRLDNWWGGKRTPQYVTVKELNGIIREEAKYYHIRYAGLQDMFMESGWWANASDPLGWNYIRYEGYVNSTEKPNRI